MTAVLAFVWLSLGAVDPDLQAAEAAYAQAQYREVLPSLARALSRPLPQPEKLRAYELMAFIHAAFDDGPAAVEAFRRALGAEPSYRLQPDASPKLVGLFSQAVGLGPLAPPPPPEKIVVVAPEPPPPPPPLYKRWYVWAGIAVAIAAGTAAGVYAAGSRVPKGSLGTGALQ